MGLVGATIFAGLADMTDREGARGYFALAIGLIGAVIGLIVALVFYGRSAPAGQGPAYTGSGALGVIGLVAAVAFAIWAFMQLRETPLKYDGAMATLEMEFRVSNADLPASASDRWLSVEVQTEKTRPEGTVIWSAKRTEGDYSIIPVAQGPLYRSGRRMIVVRVGDQQVEVFSPPMKRTPDPKADWSEWYRARAVDPPYGVVPPAPLKSKLELRYKIRIYGQ